MITLLHGLDRFEAGCRVDARPEDLAEAGAGDSRNDDRKQQPLVAVLLEAGLLGGASSSTRVEQLHFGCSLGTGHRLVRDANCWAVSKQYYVGMPEKLCRPVLAF